MSGESLRLITLRARSSVTSVRGRGAASSSSALCQPSSSVWWRTVSKRPSGLEAAPRPLMAGEGGWDIARIYRARVSLAATGPSSRRRRYTWTSKPRHRGDVPMSTLHPVSPEFAARARIGKADYERLYAESVRDPEGFWGQVGKRLDWAKAPTQVKDVSFDPADLHIRWYGDGTLNVAANCLDRHLAERGDKTAIIFEGDDPGESRRISYRELHAEVCKFANTLKHLGVAKGDRVAIYLPMIPEAAVAMLACARIGAIHSVVFGGFSPDSLAGRIADSQCKLVITADEGLRGGKKVPLKANVDEALTRPGTTSVETVLVVQRTGAPVGMQVPRDRFWSALMEGQSTTHQAAAMNAEDPLFILYTSGSTGKP